MDNTAVGLVFGFILGGILMGLTVVAYSDNWWQRQIQQRGYSEYCQDDGSWSWKGECND